MRREPFKKVKNFLNQQEQDSSPVQIFVDDKNKRNIVEDFNL